MILTAIAVPKIPPAKLLVPNKPNTVVLCWSENQLVSDFTQFGQAVDWIQQFEIHLTVAYKSYVTCEGLLKSLGALQVSIG